MATFIMMGKYSLDALREISSDRTSRAVDLIEGFGGEIESMYALLGPQDLVFTVKFHGVQEAMKASLALSKMTGISFSTYPAVTVKDFDRMIG